jgi:hypothetical protein
MGNMLQISTKPEHMIQAWWSRPVIPALGKLRQEDGEFKASQAT